MSRGIFLDGGKDKDKLLLDNAMWGSGQKTIPGIKDYTLFSIILVSGETLLGYANGLVIKAFGVSDDDSQNTTIGVKMTIADNSNAVTLNHCGGMVHTASSNVSNVHAKKNAFAIAYIRGII